MTSAAAKKAWESRRRHGTGHSSKSSKSERKSFGHHGKSHHKSHGGMPESVKNYFKWINAGKSKAEAKRLSGMGKAPEAKEGGSEKKVSKSWGPGNPLYDWKQKNKK